MKQRTLAEAVRCAGIGLHSGRQVNLTIRPAPVNHGIQFTRTDLPDAPSIPAHFNKVIDTSLATVIGADGFIVSTIEHLMASFAGLCIDNAAVELDAYEVPVMDGSAGPFTDLLRSAGTVEQDAPRHFFIIKTPLELNENGRSVGIYPCSTFRITCTIDFEHPRIRRQSVTTEVCDERFERDICRARTFGFLSELEQMRRFGLARGGSLDNAVVLNPHDILNAGGLRYPDEFVRHKLLDCIGDFSLIGMPLLGHLKVHRSGHAFNHSFLKLFLENKAVWKTDTLLATADVPN